jgi:hypothetical protein
MTSTTSEKSGIFPHRPLGFIEKWFMQRGLVFLLVIPVIWMVACEQAQSTKSESHASRVPVAVGETVATVPTPEPPKTPDAAAPHKEHPFYGSTFFDGIVTSVYYYPSGGASDGTPDGQSTHVKFDHREDDLWICGDVRSKFDIGRRTRMTVTFEANADCVTNWKMW